MWGAGIELGLVSGTQMELSLTHARYREVQFLNLKMIFLIQW